MGEINVMLHHLVPEHILLSEKEAKKVLEDLNLSKEQLPKIRREDPPIQILEKVHGPIEEGRVVKILRKSETAGVAVVYRLVVEKVG
jgi:DNA-directed RNA polymerase subunit H